MVNKRITDEAAAGPLTGAELVRGVQGGNNVKIELQDVVDLVPTVTGFTGSIGQSNAVGFTGSKGFTGSLGFTGSSGGGFTGSIGFTGYTGSRGLSGYDGSKGFSGSFGFTGSIGYTGSRGVTGFSGSFAAVGFVGSRGFTGSIGFTGSAGFTGSQGVIGFSGSKGSTGGANTQVVFNDSTFANASPALTFNKATNTITIANSIIITPNTGLRVGANSITANGYSWLTNGLLIQWGTLVVNTTSIATFSVAFPIGPLNIQVTPIGTDLAGANTPVAASSNATTATIRSLSTTTTNTAYYTAMGH